MTRKKLVFVESASGIGGVEYSTLFLACSLDHSKWDVRVIYPCDGPMSNACRERGVSFRILPRGRLRSTSICLKGGFRLPNVPGWFWNLATVVAASRRLAGYLKKAKPDLLVTKGLPSHFLGGLAARELKVPCLWHLQDFVSESFFGVYRRLIGVASRHLPSYVVADGVSILHQLPPDVRKRAEVVLNAVDSDAFHPGIDGHGVRAELGIPLDSFVIGNVARLTPWKGQQFAIEAFSKIADNCPEAYLLLVGGPTSDTCEFERALHRRVSKLRLNERVIFAGYRQDLPSVMAAMDVFVYTAVEKDTSPLSVLSAMAMGLPVLAFDIEGIRELFVGEDPGNLVAVGDISSLAQRLDRIQWDHQFRSRLAGLSRQLAEGRYGLNVFVSTMDRILQRVCHGS